MFILRIIKAVKRSSNCRVTFREALVGAKCQARNNELALELPAENVKEVGTVFPVIGIGCISILRACNK